MQKDIPSINSDLIVELQELTHIQNEFVRALQSSSKYNRSKALKKALNEEKREQFVNKLKEVTKILNANDF